MLKHKIVTGLGFGDEGKGTVVDALCARSDYGYVVRHSGGPQAAHNVVDDRGRHHTFSQFGSGTLSQTPTILSRFMMVNPDNLRREAVHLSWLMGCTIEELYDNIHVSENSLLITPHFIEANKKVAKNTGHGSCAQGVGMAMFYSLEFPDKAIRMGDLRGDFTILVDKLTDLYFWAWEIHKVEIEETPWDMAVRLQRDMVAGRIVKDWEIATMIREHPCVFEGSQGILLDEWHGFHPHTTWSTTTDHNAHRLLSEAGVPIGMVESIGVIRSFHTRHGAGPFPTELKAGGLYDYLMSQEKHNKAEEFQGNWRVGAFDIELLEYALSCMYKKPDFLAMTFLDLEEPLLCVNKHKPGTILPKPNHEMTQDSLAMRERRYTRPLMRKSFDINTCYVHQGKAPTIVDSVEEFTGINVEIKSFGPGRLDKYFSDVVDSNLRDSDIVISYG